MSEVDDFISGLDRTQNALTPEMAQRIISENADPRYAKAMLATAKAESGFQNAPGDSGSSFTPFQIHYGGMAKGGNAARGLGDEYFSQTGQTKEDIQTPGGFAKLVRWLSNNWDKYGTPDTFHAQRSPAFAQAMGQDNMPVEAGRPDMRQVFSEMFPERRGEPAAQPGVTTGTRAVGMIPASLPPWGPAQNFARNALSTFMGDAGAGILGATSAAKQAITEGGSPSEMFSTFQNLYPQARTQWEESARRWGRENPTANLATTIGGQALPQIAAFKGLGMGAEALGGLAPALRPALNFALGTGGGEGFVGQTLSNMAGGATQGALGNAVLGENPLSGAAFGAPLGLAFGWAPRMASEASRLTTTPELAAAAQGRNVPASGLLEGEPAARALAAAGRGNRSMLEDFTRRAADFVGAGPIMEAEGAKGLTPEIMTKTRDALYKRFDDFAQRAGHIYFDNGDLQKIETIAQAAAREYGRATPEAAAAVRDTVDHIKKVIGGASQITDSQGNPILHGMTASEFRQLTRSDSTIDNLMDHFPVAMEYGKALKDFMYDALEKSAPEAKAELDQLRGQYKNYLGLKKVVPTNEEGLLEPKRVAAALGKDDSDFGRFAREGSLLPSYAQATAPKKSVADFAERHPFLTMAGGAGLAGAGEFIREHAGHIIPTIQQNPLIAGGLGAEGLAYILANALRARGYANPELAQNIVQNTLRGAPMGYVNPLILGVPSGTELWNSRR